MTQKQSRLKLWMAASPPTGASSSTLQRKPSKDAIDEFYRTEQYPTLTGLTGYLGLSRSSMFDYKQRPGYSNILIDAYRKMEAIYEKRLIYGSGKNQAGLIFALRVGMKWRDSDPPEVDVRFDEAKAFSEKIREVNKLYMKKKP